MLRDALLIPLLFGGGCSCPGRMLRKPERVELFKQYQCDTSLLIPLPRAGPRLVTPVIANWRHLES